MQKRSTATAAATFPQGRRGRPTRARVEAIERLIVETARTLFLSHGYAATAMEMIAAGAGVSKGTLYSRYPSKAGLFAAVVEERVATWSTRAAARDALLPHDLRGRLEHHARTAIESMNDPDVAGFANMMLAARPQFPELAQIYFGRAVLYQVGVVTREIEAAAARDGFSCDDPQAVAFALLEATLGWSSIRLMGSVAHGRGTIEDAARDIVERTLRGFGLSSA